MLQYVAKKVSLEDKNDWCIIRYEGKVVALYDYVTGSFYIEEIFLNKNIEVINENELKDLLKEVY